MIDGKDDKHINNKTEFSHTQRLCTMLFYYYLILLIQSYQIVIIQFSDYSIPLTKRNSLYENQTCGINNRSNCRSLFITVQLKNILL